jgi:hypothetical protein
LSVAGIDARRIAGERQRRRHLRQLNLRVTRQRVSVPDAHRFVARERDEHVALRIARSQRCNIARVTYTFWFCAKKTPNFCVLKSKSILIST